MLDEGIHGFWLYVFLELEWLDDLSGLGKHVRLNQPLVALTRGPLSADGHIHHTLERLYTVVLVRQVFQPVLVGKLLVSVLGVQDDAPHFIVHSFLFQFLNAGLLQFSLFSNLRLVLAFFDANTGPVIPASLDLCNLDFCSQFILYFGGLLLFELLNHFIIIFSDEQ